MTVLTGPNASTSCGSGRFGSTQRSSIGETNAPRSASAPDDLDVLRVAERQSPGGLQGLERAADLLALFQAGERAHPHAFCSPACRR